jgi:hypothetical protein
MPWVIVFATRSETSAPKKFMKAARIIAFLGVSALV